MKHQVIHRLTAEKVVTAQQGCQLLGVSRSGFYEARRLRMAIMQAMMGSQCSDFYPANRHGRHFSSASAWLASEAVSGGMKDRTM